MADILYVWLWIREGRAYDPFRRQSLPVIVYGGLSILYIGFYLMGTYADPVKSPILWCAYPILPLIAARVILKEGYSRRQYICIWVIALASIAFCLTEGM